MFLTGLIIGVIIGANIGLVMAAMFVTSARCDDPMIQNPESGKCI